MFRKGIAVVLCVLLLGVCSFAMAAENVELSMTANPTTGYDWAFVVADESIVSIESNFETGADLGAADAAAPAEGEMIAGQGGLYTFTLKGLAAGETTVAFEYARSFEENSTIVGLTYTVRVDENLNVTIIGSTVGV